MRLWLQRRELFTRSFSCSSGFARSFTRFFVRSFSPVSVRWTVKLLTRSLGYSFAHPVIRSLVLPLARSFAFLAWFVQLFLLSPSSSCYPCAASTFHSNCDGKGPTVAIIQVGSYIFGGYTDVSWSNPSPGKYQFIVVRFPVILTYYFGLNLVSTIL